MDRGVWGRMRSLGRVNLVWSSQKKTKRNEKFWLWFLNLNCFTRNPPCLPYTYCNTIQSNFWFNLKTNTISNLNLIWWWVAVSNLNFIWWWVVELVWRDFCDSPTSSNLSTGILYFTFSTSNELLINFTLLIDKICCKYLRSLVESCFVRMVDNEYFFRVHDLRIFVKWL